MLPVLRPDWPAPSHVQALCTTRHGGVSSAPYDSLNLGLHVDDQVQDVLRNRALLQSACAVRPVFLSQVHGTDLLHIDAQTPDGAQADACWTQQSNVACTIMVADCLPVLFTDTQGRAVVAAHAGWRGLAAGVLENTLEHLCRVTACEPADWLVWLGPCIGPTAFEVGEEVRQAFEVQSCPAHLFQPVGKPGKWWADLAGLARWRLMRAGVSALYGNDSTPTWCTVSDASRFFSYRRDGRSGRFAACIWLQA